MTKPFRMLLAVDLSLTSARVLSTAQDLAKRLDAEVILVHAFLELPGAPTLAATVKEDPYVPYLEAEAQMHHQEVDQLTEQWARRLREQGLKVELVARPGHAADVILAAADEYDVDLLVLGRHGMGRVRRFLMGSITREVSEKAGRPVTIIPIEG